MAETPAVSTPNGLASLTQKRVRRAMPPPRHPSKKPAAGGPAGGGVESQTVVPAVEVVSQPSVAAVPDAEVLIPRPLSPVTAAEPVAAPSSVPARPATVYLDEAQVSFLEQARVAGLLSSPRLDLSKSAVVRLALRRLQEQMSVDEVCAVLRSQPLDPAKTGRKKR